MMEKKIFNELIKDKDNSNDKESSKVFCLQDMVEMSKEELKNKVFYL
jgi:hypothetical protein